MSLIGLLLVLVLTGVLITRLLPSTPGAQLRQGATSSPGRLDWFCSPKLPWLPAHLST